MVAIVLVFSLFLCGNLQELARDKMRNLWKPIIDNTDCRAKNRSFVEKENLLCILRDSDLYKNFFKIIRKLMLPLLAGIIVVWLMLAALSQGIFSMLDSAGYACEPQKNPLSQGVLLQGRFPSKSLCWAIGMNLEKGKA